MTGLGDPVAEPALARDHIVTADNMRLPLRTWLPDGAPQAVLFGLHGFNDHSGGFEAPAEYWAARGIATYAIDQRGFGGTTTRGLWPGREAMVSDFRIASRLLRERHPGTPVFAIGVSMGGAVILTAMGTDHPPELDGVILSAAGVEGGGSLPEWQRSGLKLMAHLMPWAQLTGRGVRTHPSDNIEMLRALRYDSRILKYARMDAVYGLVSLTGDAFRAAPRLYVPALVLYGRKEDIVPRRAREALLEELPDSGNWRLAEYKDGYHLLLRDLNAELVLADIVAWIADRNAPLPSGMERPDKRLAPE